MKRGALEVSMSKCALLGRMSLVALALGPSACKKSSAPATGAAWTATDLGPGRLVALNASGQLLGIDPTFQTFIVSDAGARTSLPSFSDGGSTVGTAIDGAGNVVGYSEDLTGRHAVRSTGGGAWSALDAGSSWSAAIGVSDDGDILGVAGTGTIAEMRAFALANGAPVALPLPSTADSAAYLGAAGRVAGVYETASGDTHAFVIASGALQDLGTLGGANSAPYGMSSSGEVVGVAELDGGVRHAFHASAAGAMTDLGVPAGMVSSDARGIDSLGRIAGNSYDPGGLGHPIVFTGGGVTVELVSPDAGSTPFVSAYVAAMSPDGRIVGWGVPQSASDAPVHCILWTPGN